MSEEDYKIAYGNVMIANKMLEKELDKFRPFKNAYEMKKEIERLKERISYLERSNDRREDTILDLREEVISLQTIINKTKEYIVNNDIMKVSKEKDTKGSIFCDTELLDILKEVDKK